MFDSDKCVHRLLTDRAIVREIAGEFGEGVVTDGSINRPALRDLVFADAGKRQTLEGILHPRVLEQLRGALVEVANAGETDLFVADVPLFFESGNFDVNSDQVLVVGASRDVQIRRIQDRSNGSIDHFLATRIVEAQMPLDIKFRQGDRVVWNDGDRTILELQATQVVRPYLGDRA